MPRTTKPSTESTVANGLALSELHLRLEYLEKQHQSILKQIKKKRTELNNFVEKARTLATEVVHRANPSFQKMTQLDQEIHALFETIFTTRKFGKQTLKKIQAVYRQLQSAGIISIKPDTEQFQQELNQEFFPMEEDFSTESAQNPHQNQHCQAQDYTSFGAGARTETQQKIRSTFLRLAEIFHPDKAQDSETQKYHTEIMQEINSAYQEGDLARLLEIESRQQVGERIDFNNEDDLTRKCRHLEQQNQILQVQYENLKRELRLAKNTPEGAMFSSSRKAKKQGIDAVAGMVEAIESQIQAVSEIRDFVKDFQQHQLTIQEFLAGPVSLYPSEPELLQDILEQMFSELI
ncbi:MULTISPECIES: J domain-containing protein [Nostoc]|uniref:J domain-containing protein n=1 Tax=Nostoc paludosum FACHB-159 TaxID=2692908 RepID=A0ABR8KMN0_9NOSO|nr:MULTISPECIES: J domain-containing protein [Nostoc]MBD2683560.1 J domain-containing protein [Nostoc sp. FACHB-857]MBD2739878.1 J domain-containing protein [Nostoc paludosum FACHB-159]